MNQSSKLIIRKLLVRELHVYEGMLRDSQDKVNKFWLLCDIEEPDYYRFDVLNAWKDNVRRLSKKITSIKLALKETKYA